MPGHEGENKISGRIRERLNNDADHRYIGGETGTENKQHESSKGGGYSLPGALTPKVLLVA